MKHLSAFGALLFSATTFADPLSISSGIVHEAHCGQANGAIDTYATGGTAPYTYDWSPDPPSGDGTPQIYGLAPGDWTLTVTDFDGTQASQVFTITNDPDLLGTEFNYPAQDSHANCPGQCWGEFRVPESYLPGVAPYQYSEPIAGYDILGEPFFYVPGGACGGATYQIGITDDTGCSGTMTIMIAEPQVASPPMTITSIMGSCTGGIGGSVTVENVYDGAFFQAPALTLYDMQDNYIAGQQGVGQTVVFNALPPGQYYAKRDWNWSYPYTAFPCDMDATLPFDIPDLGVACGTVSGDVFIDNDQDCTQGGGEVNVPELVLQIEPGGTYAITDANGHYSVDLGDGSYTLAQNDASLVQICPVTSPVPFTLASNAVVIDLADSSSVPLDLQAFISGTAAHPGMSITYALKVKNGSPQVSGPVTMTLNADLSLTFLSATVTPTSVVGNTITWDLAALTAYAQQTIGVQFEVAVGAPLGSSIFTTMYVTNTQPDANVVNNNAALNTTVTGSFDPNEKVVQPADIFFLDIDDHLSYVIRFQNTGTDTAYNVVVTDTLSADLDMGSFLQGASSHPCTVEFLADRVVRWTFADILLPDNGTNEAASHGFIGFDIKPAPGLGGGIYINNASDIYFDFNDPVRTNTASVLAEFSVGFEREETQGGALVYPNPARDVLRLTGLPSGSRQMRTEVRANDGRLCHVGTLNGNALDITSLATGSYVLMVHFSNGERIIRPFIKY